ncbi:MAG: serine/threonine protein kinase [Rubrivivax sp.]|nr:serine/threonine protein kinase [Rubrivivax sp.]
MSEAARALPEAESALPPGTRLNEFEIRSLLGVGGFGIVYLAFDHALEREVAVKEYMPASMAGRTESLHVSLRSKSDTEVFGLGLKSFVNEAKLLAKFDHPSLIKVHRFWEANGTAYMAMPVLRGHTLKEIRRSTGRAPDESWIRSTTMPLLGALEQLHADGVYHRDIAPDNIHLEKEGQPVLLDFGAARRVISGKTQSLTAILKPAYAPIEQYAETGAVKQGPWTDLYALGATLHFMLLGYPPVPATARTVAEEATELVTRGVPGISGQMLAIIDWMLSPKPAGRPQSVAELRAVLEGRAALPVRVGATAPPATWDMMAVTAPITVPMGADFRPDVELDDLVAAPPAPAPAPGDATRVLSAAALPRTPSGEPTVPRTTTSSHTGVSGMAAQRSAAAHVETLSVAADDAHRLPPPPARSRAVPLALAGVVVAGVLGYFGWSRMGAEIAGAATSSPAASAAAAAPAGGAANAAGAPSTVAGAAAAPAASSAPDVAAAAAVPVASPTPSAASSPASASAAGSADAAMAGTSPPAAGASAAATVVAPAAAGVAAASAPTASTAAATTPPTAPSVAPASLPARTAPAGPPVAAAVPPVRLRPPPPGGAPQPGAAAGPRPAAAPALPARPGSRAETAVPPAAVPGPAEPGPGATPEGLCAGRNQLSHHVCMERECQRPRFRNHPDCQAWRQQARPQ